MVTTPSFSKPRPPLAALPRRCGVTGHPCCRPRRVGWSSVRRRSCGVSLRRVQDELDLLQHSLPPCSPIAANFWTLIQWNVGEDIRDA